VSKQKAFRPRSPVLVLIALILTSTLVALVLGELVLRAIFNPGDYLYASVIDDPVLGRRIEPYTSGHDALGFRNREVPERVSIVALGDSQTYGVGVFREDTWPQQLAGLLHQPIYNMALGGFGPLEEMYLAEHEATRLQPQLLLVGLYFGNDIAEAYRSAHQRPYWYDWREATVATPAHSDDDPPGAQEPQKRFGAVRDWLARKSVLYGFLRARVFHRLAILEKDRLATQSAPESQMVWVDPADHSIRTIFTAQRRLAVLETRRPDIQEGLRITKRAFEAMKVHVGARGARLLVVLIPTKERAYCPYLEHCGNPMPAALVRLCAVEERVKGDVIDFFESRGIDYVDVTQALSDEARRHTPIYPQDSDGHPAPAGHAVIARVVFDALQRHQVGGSPPR
jgi:hypothetical protein